MALPPIITSSPIYKALSGTMDGVQSRKPENRNAEQSPSSSPRDEVDLSAEALARMEAAKAEDIRSEQAARQIASEVRYVLENDVALTMGQAF